MQSIRTGMYSVLAMLLALVPFTDLYSGEEATFTFTATLRGENQIALGIDSSSFRETSINSARLAGGTLIFSFDGPEPVSILAGEDLPAGSDFMSTEDSFGPAPMARTEIGNDPAWKQWMNHCHYYHPDKWGDSLKDKKTRRTIQVGMLSNKMSSQWHSDSRG